MVQELRKDLIICKHLLNLSVLYAVIITDVRWTLVYFVGKMFDNIRIQCYWSDGTHSEKSVKDSPTYTKAVLIIVAKIIIHSRAGFHSKK